MGKNDIILRVMKTNGRFRCCMGHDFISRIVAMLNDTLQIYLLMIFKLTHRPIPIEFRDRNTK